MKILIACEESQVVCTAFREKGHETYSCDILPTSGKHPEWHLQQDVIPLLNEGWDLIIAFPPCTDLAVSGCRWFDKKRESGKQENSIRFFFEIWKHSACVENPIGIMNGGKYIKQYYPKLYQEMFNYGFPFKPTQIIHPYMFGDGERKATCLWLKDLQPLRATNIVPINWIIGKNGKKYTATHYGTCFKTNKDEQGKIRSKTFPGIANAMADQWGNK
jgi:hypothetical protein